MTKSTYTKEEHAAYMREWRKRRPMSEEQRRKGSCRSYANVYQRRGKLEPQPCQLCGGPGEEKHHTDYEMPLQVTWLCRPCHVAHHSRQCRT